MTIETKIFCPLNAECESIKDGVIHKCMWHVELEFNHPQTGEKINQKGCAMAWTPLLLVENSRQQKSTAAAVETLTSVAIGSASEQTLIAAKTKLIS